MALIRPRLTDHFDIGLLQEDADFAIPFLDEDLPLCVDPFLLWKSPSMQDQSLYGTVINAFNHLGHLAKSGKSKAAQMILVAASECEEVGLGFSPTRKGARIGSRTADRILALFEDIPAIRSNGFIHFEEIQLYVDGIGRDRISDIACSFLKSFLIDFTIDQCNRVGIPLADVELPHVYDLATKSFRPERVQLPVNPVTGTPMLLVPKRWLRATPWISYDDYVDSYYAKELAGSATPDHIEVLNFNRNNYDLVQAYIRARERSQADCRNDPLFKPIPVFSAKRKMSTLRKLPSGKADNADRKYEDLISQLMASMLYPELDFAQEQSRTDSGVLIRDLVFYNGRSLPFLKDVYDQYGSRQIVFELKNVKQIDRDHINQLNRYLSAELGSFGILVTRNDLSSAMFKNTIDLWSGQRKCILALSDSDLQTMATVFASKQRLPVEVIQAKYVEFTRSCPS